MNPALTLLVAMTVAAAHEEPLRYLALGDSYTIGEAVSEEARWPAVLAARLRQAGIPVIGPRIIATTGWTTDELAAAMDASGLSGCHDLVSLLIGVNNQYRGRSVENFRSEYAALLERAVDLAGGRTDRVFVLSIPDWSVTPFAAATDRDLERMAAGIDAYNAAKREITEARGVRFFDITPSTREVPEDPGLVAEDGLHPSAALYASWVEQIQDAVLAGVRATPRCP